MLVEYLAFVGDCEHKLAERLEREKNRAVDPIPGLRGGLDTFLWNENLLIVAFRVRLLGLRPTTTGFLA